MIGMDNLEVLMEVCLSMSEDGYESVAVYTEDKSNYFYFPIWAVEINQD